MKEQGKIKFQLVIDQHDFHERSHGAIQHVLISTCIESQVYFKFLKKAL